MKSIGWLILTAILVPLSQVHAQDRLIKLTTCNWQPYAGVNLTRLGFTSELMTLVFKEMGYEVRIDILPWKRALLKTASGRYDAIYNAYFSEDRAKTYALTDPYIHSKVYLCSQRSANISFDSLKDLEPYKIGVVMGYVNGPEFDTADFLNKEGSVTELENLKKLITGRLDLVAIDQYVAVHLVKTSPFLIANVTNLVFHEPPLSTMPVHAMFSRAVSGYEKQVHAFNKALAKLIRQGDYNTLMEIHNFR